MTWGSSAALKLQEMFVLPNSSLVSVCQFSFQPALCLRIHISWWFHQKLHHVCITSQYLVCSAVFSKPSESAWKDLCPIQPGGVPHLIFEDLSKSSRKTHNFSRNAAQSNPNILLPPETFAAKPTESSSSLPSNTGVVLDRHAATKLGKQTRTRKVISRLAVSPWLPPSDRVLKVLKLEFFQKGIQGPFLWRQPDPSILKCHEIPRRQTQKPSLISDSRLGFPWFSLSGCCTFFARERPVPMSCFYRVLQMLDLLLRRCFSKLNQDWA